MDTKVLLQPARIIPAVLVIIVALLAWLPTLDNLANEQIDEGFKRSVISFATARALNAAISVAQGTEASAQPGGLGLVFKPGQALDPINDLVEQFSDLMIIASVAFGIEKILVSLGGAWLIPFLLLIVSALWAYGYVWQKPMPRVLSRVLIILLLIRFAVPVMTLGSGILFDQFLDQEYTSSQSYLDRSSSQLNQLETPNHEDVKVSEPQKPAEDTTWIEKLSNNFSLPTFSLPSSPVQSVMDSVTAAVDHIVNLMVVFALQVLVLPLAILWILYSILCRVLESSGVSNQR